MGFTNDWPVVGDSNEIDLPEGAIVWLEVRLGGGEPVRFSVSADELNGEPARGNNLRRLARELAEGLVEAHLDWSHQ